MTAAVADATEQAVNKTKAEVEAIQAAQKAAADTQALRELEDKCEALQTQLAATTDNWHALDGAMRWAPLGIGPAKWRQLHHFQGCCRSQRGAQWMSASHCLDISPDTASSQNLSMPFHRRSSRFW